MSQQLDVFFETEKTKLIEGIESNIILSTSLNVELALKKLQEIVASEGTPDIKGLGIMQRTLMDAQKTIVELKPKKEPPKESLVLTLSRQDESI